VSDTYEPSPWDWVREQVEAYERSDGREGNTLLDTGLPIVVFTCRGHRSGRMRKVPVMRVEHDGRYALVGSLGGAPRNPSWVANLRAHPDDVVIQDASQRIPVSVREVDGDERSAWWDRAVTAYPPYAEYQQRTERRIPVFLAEPRPS